MELIDIHYSLVSGSRRFLYSSSSIRSRIQHLLDVSDFIRPPSLNNLRSKSIIQSELTADFSRLLAKLDKTTEKQVVKDRIQKSMAHVQRLETFVPYPVCSSTRRMSRSWLEVFLKPDRFWQNAEWSSDHVSYNYYLSYFELVVSDAACILL